ncbi:MAG: glycosyltransferase family 1 protein [Acidobacteriota bacterium]
MTAPDPVRIALDISKAASRDGLGSYTRGLVAAMAELYRDAEAPPAVSLLNLLGADSADEILGALQDASGELPPCFHADLERWPERTAAQQEAALSATGALLATSWSLPAAAPPSLFVVYDLTFLSHPHCHTLHNRLHCAEGLLRARLQPNCTLAPISEASAAELRRYFGESTQRTVVAPPGLGSAFRRREGAWDRVKGKYEIVGGDPSPEGFVLSVGSLEPRKNLGRLLEAHRLLPLEKRLAFPLLLVGGAGWRLQDLDLGLTEDDPQAVKRLGSVSEEDLVDLFSAATLFVYPSLAEGFGLPVLEAMACGAPVVASNVSSLPEVAGDAARLVDPQDARQIADTMEALLSDGAARDRLRRRGLGRVGRFAWHQTAKAVDLELRRLAGA